MYTENYTHLGLPRCEEMVDQPGDVAIALLYAVSFIGFHE
jgi:hypothetical protein